MTVSSERRLLGGTIVTLDASETVIPNGEICYDANGVITYVGVQRGPAREGDLDVTGSVVMPGFVNSHAHSGMTPLRGLSDNKDLAGWLADMRQFEVRMTEDDHRWALRLALIEMLQSGTTSFADMFRWNAVLIADVLDAGMRVNAAPAITGYESVSFPAAGPEDGRATLELTEHLGAEFAGESRVRVSFGPHAVYTCPPDLLRDVSARAERTGLGIHIHLSEDAREVSNCIETYGATPIAHAAAHGILANRTLVAHATKATEADIVLLAAHDAYVAHNPVSNLKLGSGIAPIPEMLHAGVSVALGTDGAASNNRLDMFEEVKVATIVQRGLQGSASVTRSADYLRLATSGGGAALGFSHVGALTRGNAADLVVVSTSSPRGTPLHNATSFLTFAAAGQDVTDVIIDGNHVVRGGVVTTLNEAEVRARVAATAHRITAEMGAAS